MAKPKTEPPPQQIPPADPPAGPLNDGPVVSELAVLRAENAVLKARLAEYEPVQTQSAQPDHWCIFKRAVELSRFRREKLRRYCENGTVQAHKKRGQWIVNATHASRVRLEESRLGNER
jgi:hypothetical protein